MPGRPALAPEKRRVKVQVYIDPQVHALAGKLSAKTGASLSETIAAMARAGAKPYALAILNPVTTPTNPEGTE